MLENVFSSSFTDDSNKKFTVGDERAFRNQLVNTYKTTFQEQISEWDGGFTSYTNKFKSKIEKFQAITAINQETTTTIDLSNIDIYLNSNKIYKGTVTQNLATITSTYLKRNFFPSKFTDFENIFKQVEEMFDVTNEYLFETMWFKPQFNIEPTLETIEEQYIDTWNYRMQKFLKVFGDKYINRPTDLDSQVWYYFYKVFDNLYQIECLDYINIFGKFDTSSTIIK